jgi:hypothetical protein
MSWHHPTAARARDVSAVAIWGVIGLLAGAACYQLLIAVGVLRVGPHPGEVPYGYDAVVGAPLLVLAFSGLALLVASLSAHLTRLVSGWPLAVAGLAAVGFVIARFVSYDPYYAPTLRRMTDGAVQRSWIELLVVAAVAVAWCVIRRPRVGVLGTAAVMWLSAATALVAGLGH